MALIKILFYFSCFFSTTLLMAQEQQSLDTAKEIYQEFLSPFCPGRSLADCPSKRATNLKAEILDEISSGKSKEVMLDELADEYGAELNSKPALTGFSGLAWFIPIIFLLLGGAVLFLWFKKSGKVEES